MKSSIVHLRLKGELRNSVDSTWISPGEFTTITEVIEHCIREQSLLKEKGVKYVWSVQKAVSVLKEMCSNPTVDDKMLIITHKDAEATKSGGRQLLPEMINFASKGVIGWILPETHREIVEGESETFKKMLEKSNNIAIYYYSNAYPFLANFLRATATMARYDKSCFFSNLVVTGRPAAYIANSLIANDYYNTTLWFLVTGLITGVISQGLNATVENFIKLNGGKKPLISKELANSLKAKLKRFPISKYFRD